MVWAQCTTWSPKSRPVAPVSAHAAAGVIRIAMAVVATIAIRRLVLRTVTLIGASYRSGVSRQYGRVPSWSGRAGGHVLPAGWPAAGRSRVGAVIAGRSGTTARPVGWVSYMRAQAYRPEAAVRAATAQVAVRMPEASARSSCSTCALRRNTPPGTSPARRRFPWPPGWPSCRRKPGPHDHPHATGHHRHRRAGRHHGYGTNVPGPHRRGRQAWTTYPDSEGVSAIMYGYGAGWGWMMLMQLVWIALLGVIIWAVVRLVQRPADREHGTGARRETPQEILDRRYASGEIDTDTYTQARAHLAGRQPSAP